jgi:hypothetical protein
MRVKCFIAWRVAPDYWAGAEDANADERITVNATHTIDILLTSLSSWARQE